jgi:hypothetical protein
MPICVMCHEDKPAAEFAFRSLATGQLQSHCRKCHAAYRRQHYVRTKPIYIENERLRVRGHRERNRKLLVAYLLEHPCIDCGERDPVVLDFDHRDPSLKRLEVTRLAARKPWQAVLNEIAKCDVRCANCHRRRTAEQFKWRRGSRGARPPAATFADQTAMKLELVQPQPSAVDLKVCCTCKRSLPLSEFSIKNRRTGLRAAKCKACQRAYAREHYRKNRDKYLAKASRRNAVERERLALMLRSYLEEHPCVDCGTTDLRVLDFDHRNPAEKTATVNALMRSWDWERVLIEMAKCDVRCANCHRRRTARQNGWTRLLLSARVA